jgi:hypothetical protein
VAGVIGMGGVAGCSGREDDSEAADCRTPRSSSVPATEFPDDLSAASAESTALRIEERYARQRAADDGWRVQGVDWANAESRTEDSPYLVRATVSLDAVEPEREETATLSGSLYYQAWYRFTNLRAERAPSDTADPPEQGWVTVACA